MIEDKVIRDQLKFVLEGSNFPDLGKKYEGKVRDSYTKGDKRFLITTDRLSCFDKVVTSIPFKGQVLQALAVNWFKVSADIIANHIIDIPDPNVMLVKNCEILPVEVVVRAYLTGSAWRDYEKGNKISGVSLPAGMKPSQRLPQVILTPSTKAEQGQHDMPISENEIVSSGIVKAELWQQVKEAALALFALGEEAANLRGLILVDTKYEFGLYKGNLILADEIHTLDSSRYWEKNSYQEKFEKGETPEMLDKEPMRQWLISQGFMGDGPIPVFSDDKRIEITKHYIHSYERISGETFHSEAGPVASRIAANLSQQLS
jgi:phosphoribosylaminoimidazole-succinocarboxamide synthase